MFHSASILNIPSDQGFSTFCKLGTPQHCVASLSPGRESNHAVQYQIIAGVFICFNHLTDQAAI